MLGAVCQKVEQAADALQTATFDDPVVIANARIRALGGLSATLRSLNVSLKEAKAAQYKEEARLHEIAEEAFIAAGFLHAETDIDRSKLRWRLWDTPDEEEELYPDGRGAENGANSGVRPHRRAGRLLFDVKAARVGSRTAGVG